MVGGYAKFGVWIFQVFPLRFDTKLAPESVDILLLIVHSRELHHVVANCGMSTVSPYHEIKVDLDFKGPSVGDVLLITNLEPCSSGLEVGAGEFMIEEQLNIRE
jgi:hypothetical protein